MILDTNRIECLRLRQSILKSERALTRALHRQQRSTGEIKPSLELKAYLLGKSFPEVANPFEGWDHALAKELATEFDRAKKAALSKVA